MLLQKWHRYWGTHAGSSYKVGMASSLLCLLYYGTLLSGLFNWLNVIVAMEEVIDHFFTHDAKFYR